MPVFAFLLIGVCSLFSPRTGFPQSLTISGSSMLYPLERAWIAAYMKKYPDSRIRGSVPARCAIGTVRLSPAVGERAGKNRSRTS